MEWRACFDSQTEEHGPMDSESCRKTCHLNLTQQDRGALATVDSMSSGRPNLWPSDGLMEGHTYPQPFLPRESWNWGVRSHKQAHKYPVHILLKGILVIGHKHILFPNRPHSLNRTHTHETCLLLPFSLLSQMFPVCAEPASPGLFVAYTHTHTHPTNHFANCDRKDNSCEGRKKKCIKDTGGYYAICITKRNV